jgi:hypothetical protein
LHRSKVQWPADAGDRLDEDDDSEVEVDELELESDESVECTHQSMDRSSTSAATASTSRGCIFLIFSTKNIHVGPTLKFVYRNPASFGHRCFS